LNFFSGLEKLFLPGLLHSNNFEEPKLPSGTVAGYTVFFLFGVLFFFPPTPSRESLAQFFFAGLPSLEELS